MHAFISGNTNAKISGYTPIFSAQYTHTKAFLSAKKWMEKNSSLLKIQSSVSNYHLI